MGKNDTSAGPSLEELVAERNDQRRHRKAKVALLIPSFRKNDVLKKHLARLATQTYQDFDIVTVYGNEDDFLETPPGLSMLHLREQVGNGCAGAMYASQKTALEEGYETIILADNDCLPVSRNLVQELVEASGKGAPVVMPRVHYSVEKKPVDGWVIHHYCCMRKEVFETTGFTFLPFGTGGEDTEFLERVKRAGFPISHIEALATHPSFPQTMICGGYKIYHYMRGTIECDYILGNHYRAWENVAYSLMTGIALLALGKKGLSKEALRAACDAALMKTGIERRAFEAAPLPIGAEAMSWKPDEILSSNSRYDLPDLPWAADNREESSHLPGKMLFWCLEYAARLPRFFGKRVLLMERTRPAIDFPVVLVSSGCHTSYDGKRYRIKKDCGMFGVLFGVGVFAAAAPVALGLSIPLFALGLVMKQLKGLEAKGYGLPKGEGS